MIHLQCLCSSLLLLSTSAFASLPRVDFDRMGKVALAGSFAGLDLFDDSSSTVAFDPSTSSLFSRSSQGSLTRIGSTNSGGRISAGCQLGNSFYFAGTFSSIDNASASNIASYTPGSGFSALGSGGPNGEIDALFCDDQHLRVWAGGNFSSPGSSVAIWDTKASSWSPPPFSGLSGAGARVQTITTNSSRHSLFFAGSFLTSFQGNTSALNFTNNPRVPFSAGATPFSASLVPVPLQPSQVQGSPSTSNPQFADITAILCPTLPDGPGASWFGEDGTTALITVRTFTFISASGVRLGNTFQQGRGTTAFSVTTIPDNSVRSLTYTDPATGQNQTCSDACPLSSDSSIPFQDFLFTGPIPITGVQVKLSQFTGASPGLHLFQLLSSGAFASSIADVNKQSCFAPNPSNTSLTNASAWQARVANTDIPGTVQTVLVATVNVGTPSSTAPTFTWMPYVSASGNYDVTLLVPGCNNFPPCGRRTSVKVTIFPGNGLPPTFREISQRNPENAELPLYSGPIFPSTDTFSTTIQLTLADSPEGQGQDGFYEIVADRVQLVLRSVSSTSSLQSGSGTASSTSQGGRNGFGFFEWPIDASASADARTILPNSTETALDAVGFTLRNQLGAAFLSSGASIAAVAHHSSGSVFVAGNFNLTSGTRSIVVFKDNTLSSLASNGLNGPVTSLLLDGDLLFVGGSFSDTASPTTQGALRNVAAYDVTQNQWRPLQAGLNGPVNSMSFTNGHVQIAGAFSRIPQGPGSDTGIDAGGFAVWSRDSGAWVNSGGYLRGAMTFVGNGSSPIQFVAGGVSSFRRFGSSGLVMLKNGDGGLPSVTPLGVQLQAPFNTPVASSQAVRRHTARTHFPRSTLWFSHMSISHLFSRQTTNQLAPLPAPPPSLAPSVLTGVFWRNSSSAATVVVIGGNFSYAVRGSSTPAQGVAIYDPDTDTVFPLQGPQINGTARALLVANDKLYIGGEFTIPGSPINSFAVYDLRSQQWDNSNIQALQAPSAAPSVRSIVVPPGGNTLFVAGSFSAAGTLPCAAICSMEISTRQWNTLGGGIRGEVSTVALAGNNPDTLIVAGSIALSNNALANVAQYAIANLTWSPVGNGDELPGPVTALEINDENIRSVFAAGRSKDNSSSFLAHWNGSSWRPLGSSLQANATVAQLTMVPVQDLHSGNDVIEQDRMLMVSGDLFDTTVGNFSAGLYDGQVIIPYFASSTSTGSPGAISSLFRSLQSFSFARRSFLATGVVILISIAIAAGVVFLFALIGILWTLFSRRDDKLHKLDGVDVEDDDDSTQHRPSSLLEHINAATRTTIMGGTPLVAGYASEKGDKDDERAPSTAEQDPFGPDASNYVRAETPSDAVGGMLEEEKSRPARARYSFDGAGEGELQMAAGAELEVLDDRDAAWWYARDVRTGREGVVPAAYLY